MNFDWSQYLNLAKELAGQSTTPTNQEAKLRDAISRAYYSAFVLARNYLRDREGHTIPATGDAHQYVSGQFNSTDALRQSVAKGLRQLRMYRNQADYIDRFSGLSGIILIALRRAEEVISNLSVL